MQVIAVFRLTKTVNTVSLVVRNNETSYSGDFFMSENTVKTVHPIPIPKTYPVRPDKSVSLSAMALATLGWPVGMQCQITADKANNRIIVTPAESEPPIGTPGASTN